MEIRYTSACGYEEKAKSGLGYEIYKYIRFWGKDELLNKIKDFAIENFVVYKHDDTVEYGEHEVFLWSTNNHFYFILNSEKNGEERDKEIYKAIEDAVNNPPLRLTP